MPGFLEYLREHLIDGSGWDKMGRPRPTEDWADEQINEMTNVELLQQMEWFEEQNRAKVPT